MQEHSAVPLPPVIQGGMAVLSCTSIGCWGSGAIVWSGFVSIAAAPG